MTKAWLAVLLFAACDTGDGTTTKVDAPPPVPIEVVDCPAIVAATVQDSPTTFIPKETTIPAKEVVKFMITAEHFVLPNSLVNTDPLLMVRRGETKCFRFNTPGVWGFLCGVHSFTGTITVQ